MDLFRALLATEKPEIVGITETWIHTNTRDFEGEFEIPGYKTFKKDRLDREGGGVMLYVRGHLDPVECKIETEHEMVGVVLNKLEKKLHIYLVYRPPHQSAESDESLYSNLSTIIRNKFCIVAGDFNCSVNWKTQTADAESMRLLDFANEEYLTQWVDKPTRGNNTLDLVFSSEDNMISKLSVGEKLGKSDHNMIKFEILTSFTKLGKSFMKPNFRKADCSDRILTCRIKSIRSPAKVGLVVTDLITSPVVSWEGWETPPPPPQHRGSAVILCSTTGVVTCCCRLLDICLRLVDV